MIGPRAGEEGRMGRKRKAREEGAEDEPRPLWGDHWKFGSFWDALFAIRARIRTAGLALADTEAADTGAAITEARGLRIAATD